ncbi:hypothetical protein HNR42_002396 [Deinobacterium chartae]|uniref:Uncharacterized protein n=1 Tax=Deinobacterium chartae TaxID=521158 RepID=A0A841HZK6_9DEIO|nr:hypothetical protein [Deinobacterium chartae]MBB6098961.1 hypothetical protein [Deinobacterium chartae]
MARFVRIDHEKYINMDQVTYFEVRDPRTSTQFEPDERCHLIAHFASGSSEVLMIEHGEGAAARLRGRLEALFRSAAGSVPAVR